MSVRLGITTALSIGAVTAGSGFATTTIGTLADGDKPLDSNLGLTTLGVGAGGFGAIAAHGLLTQGTAPVRMLTGFGALAGATVAIGLLRAN